MFILTNRELFYFPCVRYNVGKGKVCLPAERTVILMKKLIAIFLSIVLILAATTALADTKITVHGTGEVRVSADAAVISLGVNARDKDVLKAQQKVNETIAAIRAALIDAGVKEENINTGCLLLYINRCVYVPASTGGGDCCGNGTGMAGRNRKRHEGCLQCVQGYRPGNL